MILVMAPPGSAQGLLETAGIELHGAARDIDGDDVHLLVC